MSVRTERGSIFEVAGIPKSEWNKAVKESVLYSRTYVVSLNGVVYPSSVATQLGIDGYPVSSHRTALGMARQLRAGNVQEAERRWLQHLKGGRKHPWHEQMES